MPNKHSRAKPSHSETRSSDLAYIDDLTELYNRRYLKLTLSSEIQKVKKAGKKLSLFMIDYDDFKNINDTYGHLIGDKLLVAISDILKKGIGEESMLARYAGDEFTIVLPGKQLKESLKIANNLLRLASECDLKLKDNKRLSNITLSIGVAVYPDDASGAEELLDKADQALYSSKRKGKNRVSTMSDLVAEVHDRNLSANAVPCKKFIDREKELELLKRSYESAGKGAKKVILIEGEPGVGKTRLMLELIDFSKARPTFLLKCRREDLEQEYGAISAALSSLLDSLDARGVLSALESLDDIGKYALFLMVDKIKDLPIRYSTDADMSGKDLREEDIFSAFINFIKELKLETLSVLIDDLLWIDRGSLRVIEWILKEKDASGALVVGTAASNLLKAQAAEESPFTSFLADEKVRQILERIDLKPFAKDAVSELLKAVFSGFLLPAAVLEKIYRMSGGILSNIEEIIRCLLGDKIVYPREGKWILDDKRLEEIPASLKELLDKRVSELDDESREILSKAAILGDGFGSDTLSSFHGINEGRLLDIMDIAAEAARGGVKFRK